jgi:peptidoglycan/xylan/chitin deacetylase (PgdA/CDA1 family)
VEAADVCDVPMAQQRIVFFMYHELEQPGRPLCMDDPGYVRYVIPSSAFCEQMESLHSDGWRGISVGEAVEFGDQAPGVAITFDDGCETDLISAAPVLREFGFGATFYITTGFLGRCGYLSTSQLQELNSQGFEIGSHSMTHPYLTDLDDKQLHHEIADSKTYLEQIIGKSVQHFSCPGGRFDERVSRAARDAGYLTVTTSRICTNSRSSNRFGLGRIAVMQNTSLATFRTLCYGRGLWQLNSKVLLRQTAQRLLGNSAYDRLRGALLR